MDFFPHPSESHDVRPKWYSLFRLETHVQYQEDPSLSVDEYGFIKPRVDLDGADHGKTAIATFELPGVQKSEVKIEVHDCVLTISGEKKMPSPRVKNVHSIHERLYGKFTRSLHLPNGVQLKEVQAKMENGVLILTFPNHEHGRDVEQVSVS